MIKQIRSFVESRYPILSIVSFEEKMVDELILSLAKGRSRTEITKISEWNHAYGTVNHLTKEKMFDIGQDDDVIEFIKQNNLRNRFIVIKDANLALRDNPKAISRLKALAYKIVHENINSTIFLISNIPYSPPPELEKFVTLFDLPLPDRGQISTLIKEFSSNRSLDMPDDFVTRLTVALCGLSEHEIRHLLERGFQRRSRFTDQELPFILEEKYQIIKKSGVLEMVSTDEGLKDIGGLEVMKDWLKTKAHVIRNFTKAEAFGVQAPRGVMIVGMPGCGKSLSAKAAATLFELPLLKLDFGSLMGKYVGESEGNMRKALTVAEGISPCILWIDEFEKAFVGVGSGGSGAEVATRLFGYFLTWMQDKTATVFVVATANDIRALPPELLRKGRFDEVFYVDLPNPSERENIFRIHLEKALKKQSALLDSIDISALVEMTDGFSGADIQSVVKEATEQAFVSELPSVDTSILKETISNTHSIKEVMGNKIQEYEIMIAEHHIKGASK